MPLRAEVPVEEMTARFAAMRPIVMLVDDMVPDRIIQESATEADYGPYMRRMSVYAMSPATFNRARQLGILYHGVEPIDWTIQRSHVVAGSRLIVPLQFSDGIREWRIEL